MGVALLRRLRGVADPGVVELREGVEVLITRLVETQLPCPIAKALLRSTWIVWLRNDERKKCVTFYLLLYILARIRLI